MISQLKNTGECPKTHKFAYHNGDWCCQTNKDCYDKELKMDSQCCQYSAYKECPTRKSGKKCKNNPSGKKNCKSTKDSSFFVKYLYNFKHKSLLKDYILVLQLFLKLHHLATIRINIALTGKNKGSAVANIHNT